jgi:hypothetical protein
MTRWRLGAIERARMDFLDGIFAANLKEVGLMKGLDFFDVAARVVVILVLIFMAAFVFGFVRDVIVRG